MALTLRKPRSSVEIPIYTNASYVEREVSADELASPTDKTYTSFKVTNRVDLAGNTPEPLFFLTVRRIDRDAAKKAAEIGATKDTLVWRDKSSPAFVKQPLTIDQAARLGDTMLDHVIESWREVFDPEGAPVECNLETKNILCEMTPDLNSFLFSFARDPHNFQEAGVSEKKG